MFLTYQMASRVLGVDGQGAPEEVEVMPSPLMDQSQLKGKLTRCWKD